MTLDYSMHPQVHLYNGYSGSFTYHTGCLAEAVRQHFAAQRAVRCKVYDDGSIGRPHLYHTEGFCKETQDAIDAFPKYEWYVIEEIDGQKYMHIEYSVYTISDREDSDGNPAPVVVTEYVGCKVPLKDLVNTPTDEKWDFICDCEADVQQYETEYTIEEAEEKGYHTPEACPGIIFTGEPGKAKQLHYKDISMDSPCGCYYTGW